MSSRAPNVVGVDAPGRRTVYSMCGMCAVRCPMEVTVEDGRVVWLQGNPHDKAIGASLCAKGSAGLAFEYDDDQRPQTPLIRNGPRGGGQWRRASCSPGAPHSGLLGRAKPLVTGHRTQPVSSRFSKQSQRSVECAFGSKPCLSIQRLLDRSNTAAETAVE